MNPSADLTTVLAGLRKRYAASADGTVKAFSQLAEQLQRSPAASEVVDAVRRELHRVHGTAGSYGFHEASRLAGALELVAAAWASDPFRDLERRASIVRQFARALASALTEGPPHEDSPMAHRLLLVELSDAVALPLVAEAMHRGHFVERVPADGLEALMDASLPQAVVAPARLSIRVPDGVPFVLLQDTDGEVAPHDSRSRVLHMSSEPRDVIQVAESLAAHTGMAGATLLAIDDDPAMRDLLRAIAEGEGMFVKVEESALDLVRLLEETRPALLMLDIGMPQVDGIAATRGLRADKRFAELPILVVSARTDPETRAAAFAAGADDFQAKPVVPAELTRRISRLLEIRRQRQISRGIHPATGMWLPQRTIQHFDGALAAATVEGRPSALAVLRPVETPEGIRRAGHWHRECALVAAGLGIDGAISGFSDETTLAVLLPMNGVDAAARIEPYAEASAGDVVAWCAGIAELHPGADASTGDLLRVAEEGWLAARDSNAFVHRWDETDSGIAPDVMIVEDDAALADLLGFALTARGLVHRVYRTGTEALEGLRTVRVRDRKPVVLMDVDLPGLDGFSLFERLRVERPGAFHVVFLSAHASEADQLRALRAGALDYIAKPVSLRVLMAKITVWRARGGLEG